MLIFFSIDLFILIVSTGALLDCSLVGSSPSYIDPLLVFNQSSSWGFSNVLLVQLILLVLFPWCYLYSFDLVGGDFLVFLVIKLLRSSSNPLIHSCEGSKLVG